MDKNLNTSSSLIPGLDILKFVMALLVVAIHAEAVNDISGFYEVTSPMIGCAVPVFFVISAYLVFRKIRARSITPPIVVLSILPKGWLCFMLFGWWFNYLWFCIQDITWK